MRAGKRVEQVLGSPHLRDLAFGVAHDHWWRLILEKDLEREMADRIGFVQQRRRVPDESIETLKRTLLRSEVKATEPVQPSEMPLRGVRSERHLDLLPRKRLLEVLQS